MTFAGPGRRIAAYAIDAALIAGVVALGHLLAHRFAGWSPAVDSWMRWVQFLATVSAPVWLYRALFESGRWRATPGKLALGMRVVDDDGGRLSFRRAWLRAMLNWAPIDLAYAAWILTAPLYDPAVPMLLRATLIGSYGLAGANVMAVWLTEYRQSLHDMICDTLVLLREPSHPIPRCPIRGLEEELSTPDEA